MKNNIRFKLRRFRKGDAPSLLKNINDKAIYCYTLDIPYPYTIQIARKWVNLNLEAYRKKKKKMMNFVIDINGEVAGSVGLTAIYNTHKKAELGYWLAKKYWGKGIMTQAVGQTLEYGFVKLGLNRIFAFTRVENIASQKVLQKNNFQLEGLLRKNIIKDGKPKDLYLFAILKKDI